MIGSERRTTARTAPIGDRYGVHNHLVDGETQAFDLKQTISFALAIIFTSYHTLNSPIRATLEGVGNQAIRQAGQGTAMSLSLGGGLQV